MIFANPVIFSNNEKKLLSFFNVTQNKKKLVSSFRKARLSRKKYLRRSLSFSEDKKLFSNVLKQSTQNTEEINKVKKKVEKLENLTLTQPPPEANNSEVSNEIVLNSISTLRETVSQALEFKETSLLTN